jgi:hypothetical protein
MYVNYDRSPFDDFSLLLCRCEASSLLGPTASISSGFRMQATAHLDASYRTQSPKGRVFRRVGGGY